MEYVILFSLYLSNPFIVIFHELGHAFAYLSLTKPEKIDVFIGSYGDKRTRLNFRIKKLHFYIKLSFPYIINGGMCRSSVQATNYKHKMIVVLAGPFFAFFVAVILGSYSFSSEVHGAVKWYCFMLIIWSFISLVSNLIPKTIKKAGIDNDGKQLAFVMRVRKVYSEYLLANEGFLKGEYSFAAKKFAKLTSLFPYEERFSRPLINSLLMSKNFPDAEKYLTEVTKYGIYKAEDYLMFGCLYSFTNRHDLATENYKKVLTYDPNNLVGLNNLAYELTLKEDYCNAEELLNKAIKINPDFSHPYSGLSYIRLQTGFLDEGKQLAEKSIELDPCNAYAYKHLGIYYLKVSDKENALANFNKAIELDGTIDIQEYLEEANTL
jgi:Tfp pilus assembly protein PilF